MKKDKKIIVLVVCIIIILAAMISLFIANLNHKDDKENNDTTTTTTEKISKSKTIQDNTSNLSVYFDNFEYDDTVKLVVKKVDNVTIDNVVSVYDIELVDSSNNKIEVKNTNIQISIPFNNKDNYTNFKVLYLNDKNEILDTLDANYINGNVVFKTTHLSKYAIVATKEDEKTTQEQTTTKKTTTKKVTTKQTTTKKAVDNKTTQPTTKAPTTTTTTTKKVTTTQKVKTYTYKWSTEGDSSNRYYLYIVDENGNKVNGSLTLTSKQSGSSKVVSITTEGKLLAKSLYTISNVKGN